MDDTKITLNERQRSLLRLAAKLHSAGALCVVPRDLSQAIRERIDIGVNQRWDEVSALLSVVESDDESFLVGWATECVREALEATWGPTGAPIP